MPWAHGCDNKCTAGFVPMPASADAMARYHKEVTFGNASSWDGLYLDDSQSTYSPVFAQIITAQTHSFDIDGDGRADNVSDLNAQLMAFIAAGRIRPPRVRTPPTAPTIRLPHPTSNHRHDVRIWSDLLRLGCGRFTVDWVNSISESERQFVQQNIANFAYLFQRDAS